MLWAMMWTRRASVCRNTRNTSALSASARTLTDAAHGTAAWRTVKPAAARVVAMPATTCSCGAIAPVTRLPAYGPTPMPKSR